MRGRLCRCFPPNLQYWDDRLQRMQALGINTVDTYVPWNLHEPTRGKFRFDANSWTDIERYIKLVQSKGLMMLLRIGPYICAGALIHPQWGFPTHEKHATLWQSGKLCSRSRFEAPHRSC